jgi:hypothetical protein
MAEEVISGDSTGYAVISKDAQAAILGAVEGPGMKALRLKRQSSRIELEHSGRLKPATIINFNPVRLKVECGLINFTVPSCKDKPRKGITYTHNGKKYEAAVITVREPAVIPWTRDVKAPRMEDENPSTDFDVKWALPIELADQFRANYNDINGINMGGVIVYEGDIHAFAKTKTLRVPKYSTLPDRSRSYYSEETDFQSLVDSILSQQKIYTERMIQQGDEYDQSQNAIDRGNITPVHRIWAQYSLDMGWKQTTPRWLNSSLDTETSCKGCGAPVKRTDAFFCECGRPYNAYSAYMAGEHVPESYLAALKGKELEEVVKEMARRKKLFSGAKDAN